MLTTGKLADAIKFAIDKHDGQLRKGTSIPYISHPLTVCALVLEAGGTEDEACAAVLHDVVEDRRDLPIEQLIRNQFGEHVANIVMACTEPDRSDFSWQERKDRYLEHLKVADASARLICAKDKLHNCLSLVGDLRRHGSKVWLRFNTSSERSIWFYRQVANLVADQDLTNAVHKLESLYLGTSSESGSS